MDTNELPGKQEAEALGYHLVNYSGNGNSASYHKDGRTLTVWANGTAELWAMVGLIQLTTGKMGWPNKNFVRFEQDMRRLLDLDTPH